MHGSPERGTAIVNVEALIITSRFVVINVCLSGSDADSSGIVVGQVVVENELIAQIDQESGAQLCPNLKRAIVNHRNPGSPQLEGDVLVNARLADGAVSFVS